MEVLVVSLAEIAHAIPLAQVREVLRAALPVPLPGAPAAVEGALDVRGTLVPVIDMRRRLGYPVSPLCEADHFVLTETAALRVDRAVGIEILDESELCASAALAPGVCYITHVGRSDEGIVLLTDPASFVSAHENLAVGQALEAIRTERRTIPEEA